MIARSLPVIVSVPFLVPPWEETARNPQASEKHQRKNSNHQKHQLPTRRATATSSRARPESLESGPTALPRGSWNVMPAVTWKLSRTSQVTRFLGRMPASCRDGRPVPGSWLEPQCGELVTPSECSARAPKVVGLTLSQLDMNAAHLKKCTGPCRSAD